MAQQRFLHLLIILMSICAALLPIYLIASGKSSAWMLVLAAFNCAGWLLVVMFVYSRRILSRHVASSALEFGISLRRKSLEAIVDDLLHEIKRKNDSFSISLIQQKIVTKDELSRVLERVVAQAYKLLNAESAELALFEEDSGLYHSAFVLGKPFRVSAQAMLSDAAKGEQEEISPDVLVQPVAFAGTVLGTLRVGLPSGKLPSVGDREVMNLLALQAGLALVNAEYSSELVRMKQSSEESIRAKTGFLANLSHEIRGPLGIMLNAVELVLDGLCGELTEDQLETLRMVHSNGAHLLELINDVLDYAKVESGRITPKKVEILVNQTLEDITGVVRGQADDKRHTLRCRPNDDALAIQCDKRHFRQMLINLLTNAVKYTPDGGTIEVWAERVPGNKIKINIKDSGVGIEESEQGKVFAAFERVEHSYSINQVGTGLGMPLSKKLAEVNGGSIDFSSTPGEGTHFWVTFDAIEASNAQIHEETEEFPAVDGSNDVLLLVEKDDGERRMISRYLHHIGFTVLGASSKLEALEVLRGRKVDLAIVGNNIADSPEEDLVGIVRVEADNPSLPLVLVSTRAFVFDIERYLKAGVDRCLIKPIELKELAFICRNLIDGTYSGEVVDKEHVDLTSVSGSKKNKKSDKRDLLRTKVLDVRDLTH